MNYQELKDQQRKEINAFPMAFAFSDKQFQAAKDKLDEQDESKLLSCGAGCIIRKSDAKAFAALFKKHEAEKKEFKKNEKELIKAIVSELTNYEYCIAHDITDTAEALDLDLDDKHTLSLINKAKKQYWKEHEEFENSNN